MQSFRRTSSSPLTLFSSFFFLSPGFAAITLQVSAQAGVVHSDVATVTAVVLLVTEIGNSFGSAIATAVWTNQMPKQLALHVNSCCLTLLFATQDRVDALWSPL